MNPVPPVDQVDPGQPGAGSSAVHDFYRNFYARIGTGIEVNARLALLLRLYEEHRKGLGRPVSVLDVGCGHEAVLSRSLHPEDTYTGCDIVPPVVPIPSFVMVDLNEDNLSQKFSGATFDVLFCGEVIEHLFNPDGLLEGLRALMTKESLLLLSTPNLAYWVNRLLLVAGISPLFLENSSRTKLGRRWKGLGQGNPTEGHIRVFTHRAMLDLVRQQRFEVAGVYAYPTWAMPVDRLVCRVSHHLAPGNIYALRLPRP